MLSPGSAHLINKQYVLQDDMTDELKKRTLGSTRITRLSSEGFWGLVENEAGQRVP
jgi:hypothetical protein